jgi:hypothetical protein
MNNLPNIDTVRSRRTEIASLRASLKAQDQSLATEDNELEVAERALARLAGLPMYLPSPAIDLDLNLPMDEALGSWFTAEGWKNPGRPAPDNGTIEEVIVWLLEGAIDAWANANQIKAALSGTLRRDVPMSTVSPTLSLMKNKGTIVRDGLKVALASRLFQTRVAAE